MLWKYRLRIQKRNRELARVLEDISHATKVIGADVNAMEWFGQNVVQEPFAEHVTSAYDNLADIREKVKEALRYT